MSDVLTPEVAVARLAMCLAEVGASDLIARVVPCPVCYRPRAAITPVVWPPSDDQKQVVASAFRVAFRKPKVGRVVTTVEAAKKGRCDCERLHGAREHAA